MNIRGPSDLDFSAPLQWFHLSDYIIGTVHTKLDKNFGHRVQPLGQEASG